MFGFLRKSANLSSTSTDGDVTPGVTPEVTTGVTAEVAAAITPTVAFSLVISFWAEPKPFPPREIQPGAPIQVWPVDAMPVKHPTAKQVAEEQFVALQKHCAGRWVLAMCIEAVIYPTACRELEWPCAPG